MKRIHPSQEPTSNLPGHFRQLLNDNRDQVLIFLNAQIKKLLASTDEALMEFADQAESNAVQGRFFEAMGAVRKQRADIEHRFLQEINEAFDLFGQSHIAADVDVTDSDELTLIDPEEMEESVAVENIIDRAVTTYYPQLYALGQRLAVINHGRQMEEGDILAGPTQLVNAYRAGLQQLAIDVKAKVVLYALFDKLVMGQLKEMYDEFNNSLKGGGVLPDLKPVYRRSKEGQAAAAAAQTDAGKEAHEAADVAAATYGERGVPPSPVTAHASAPSPLLGQDLFNTVLELMSHLHPSAGPAAGGGAAVRQQAVSAVNAVQPPSLQRSGGVMSDLGSLPQAAMAPGFVDNLKATVQEEREQVFAEVGGREKMDGIDADTIDLVGMLFEYMLSDPLLPNVAKALLSHLHTPYLKLTLIDRDLLVDEEHPARLLLDSLVAAGGEWVFEDDVKRGIFPHMQKVVDRVLGEFRDNVELFAELLDYFSSALDEVKRKADAFEQRAQASAQGKEKLQAAKLRAVGEIETRVGKNRVPKAVGRFLFHTWVDRLAFIQLRHPKGDQSADWTRALQAVDNLVWLFKPKTTESQRKGIARVRNMLLDEIQNGLESMGGSSRHDADELLTLLDDPRALIDWQREVGMALEAKPVAARSETAQSSPAVTKAAAEKRLSQRESEMLGKLRKLEFGTWFEFKGEGDAPPRRLKLSWLSPQTSTGMFVDRSGLQAEVKHLVELSHMLISGQARVIPQPKHPFVERALLVVKRTLQRKKA